jgi:hypothetical protein
MVVGLTSRIRRRRAQDVDDTTDSLRAVTVMGNFKNIKPLARTKAQTYLLSLHEELHTPVLPTLARSHGSSPPSGHCIVVSTQGSDRPEDERLRRPSRDRMRPWNAKVPAAKRTTGRDRSDTVWTDFKAPAPI